MRRTECRCGEAVASSAPLHSASAACSLAHLSFRLVLVENRRLRCTSTVSSVKEVGVMCDYSKFFCSNNDLNTF